MIQFCSEVWQTPQQMVDILGIPVPTRTKKPWLVLNQGSFYSWSLDEFIPRILLHTRKVGVSLHHTHSAWLGARSIPSPRSLSRMWRLPIQLHHMKTTCSTRSLTCIYTRIYVTFFITLIFSLLYTCVIDINEKQHWSCWVI